MCATMILHKKEYAKLCGQIILDAYHQCKDIRRFGGAELELCYLALG